MHRLKNLLPITILALIVGCSPPDERLVELVTKSAHEQAQQNERMAQLQQEVAAGAKQLVEADAQSRREFTSLQAQFQVASTEIAQDRDQLELERKELARLRHRDPIIASAILEAGTLLACLLPLVLCAYLLKPPSKSESCDELVVELLAADLGMQRLLPPAAQGLLEEKGAEP